LKDTLTIGFKFPPALGIDLGTTNSVIAIYHNGAVHTLAYGGTNSTIQPSIVAFVDGEDVLISWDAMGEDGTVIYDHKRILGRKWDDKIVEREVSKKGAEGLILVEREGKPVYQIQWNGQTHYITPEDITTMLLTYLKKKLQIHI